MLLTSAVVLFVAGFFLACFARDKEIPAYFDTLCLMCATVGFVSAALLPGLVGCQQIGFGFLALLTIARAVMNLHTALRSGPKEKADEEEA